MSDRPPVADAVVLRQADVASAKDVGAALDEAFLVMRDAVGAGRPLVVVLRDDDLLGQREPEAAALATALLGMVRALAFEGARRGWRVNAVSHRGDDALAEETVRWLAAAPGLSGQLVRATTEHLGRVSP